MRKVRVMNMKPVSCLPAYVAMGVLGFSVVASATQNDDAFVDYVNDQVCQNPQGNLILTCNAAATTVGGSGETLPQSGNTGSAAANELSARDHVQPGAEIKLDRWALFSSVDYQNLDRDTSDIETGYDGSALGLTVGADYRLSSRWLLGASVSHKKTELDLAGGVGKLDTTSLETLFFISAQLSDAWWLDGYVGVSQLENDARRAVTFGLIRYQADATFDGDNEQWGIGTGYQLAFGSLALDLGARYEGSQLELDGYEETGGDPILNLNMVFPDQTIDSETLTMSVQGAHNASLSNGVLVSYLRGEWVQEFEDEGREISTQLVVAPAEPAFVMITDDPDDQYGVISAGVQMVMPGGFMWFVDAETLTSHTYMDSWRATLGMRLEL